MKQYLMKLKSGNYLRGLMGILSLLGFIGVFTEERTFLAFFAFAMDFEYFFIKTDEMSEKYLNRSASRAFYCGMIATAVVALICFFAERHAGSAALTHGVGVGFGVSIAVHDLSVAYYAFKESWWLEHDKE